MPEGVEKVLLPESRSVPVPSLVNPALPAMVAPIDAVAASSTVTVPLLSERVFAGFEDWMTALLL